MSATLGTQVLNAALLGGVPTATLSTANVFAGSDEVTLGTNAAFRELQYFRDVTSDGLLTTLDRLGQGIQDVATSLDINSSLNGLPYVSAQPSEVANFQDLANRLGRDLYDPVITATRPVSVRTGYSLSNNAVFSIQLNDDTPIPVTIIQTNQSFNEPLSNFINRSLPAALVGKIVASGTQTLTLKALDPNVTKFTILFSDRSNSAAKDMGFEPGQFSLRSPKFATVQEFATALAPKMGLSGAQVDPRYDVATHSLGFELRLQGKTYTKAVPLDFSSGLGPATFLSNVTAPMVVTPTATGRVSLRMDALRTVFIAAADAPINGQISSEGRFTIKLNGGSAVTIRVPRDVTNLSIDDLVADINSELSFSSLRGKVTAGRSGNRLTLTAPTGQSLEVDAVATDTAATQLNLIGVGLGAQYGQQVTLGTGAQFQIASVVTATNLSGSGAIGILPATLSSPSITVTSNASATLSAARAVGALASSSSSLVMATPQVSLAGTVTVAVDPSLGVPVGSPASFTLGLARPNEVSTTLLSIAAAPANGRLTAPATFQISVGSGSPVTVTVPVDATNATIDDLVADINAAISSTRLGGNVIAGRSANQLTLSSSGYESLTIASAANDPTRTQLRFNDATISPAITATTNATFSQQLGPVRNFAVDDFLESVRGLQKLLTEGRLQHLND